MLAQLNKAYRAESASGRGAAEGKRGGARGDAGAGPLAGSEVEREVIVAKNKILRWEREKYPEADAALYDKSEDELNTFFKGFLDAKRKELDAQISVKQHGGLQASMGRDNFYFPQGIPVLPYMSHGEKETITMRTNFNHAKEARKHYSKYSTFLRSFSIDFKFNL